MNTAQYAKSLQKVALKIKGLETELAGVREQLDDLILVDDDVAAIQEGQADFAFEQVTFTFETMSLEPAFHTIQSIEKLLRALSQMACIVRASASVALHRSRRRGSANG